MLENMDWRDIAIHAIDFEGSRKSGVLEYGVATLRGGNVEAARTRLCAPVRAPDAKETRCHRLDEEDLKGCAPFADDFGVFRALRADGVFAAHNAAVERRLLCDVWPHPGAVPDFLRGGGVHVADWGPWIDTCALYRRLYPKLPEHSLGFLLGAFSLADEMAALARAHCPENRNQAHCALYDALGVVLLLKRLDGVLPQSAGAMAGLCAMADPFAPARGQ